MWLLFHRNAKTRVVRDGLSFVQECPECRAKARFVEVEVEENVGVWFIDVVGDKSSAFKCTACGDVFDAKDNADRAPPTSTPRSEPPTAREVARDREIRALKAELARREAARAAEARSEAAEAKENRIEDELAELKKRMGR